MQRTGIIKVVGGLLFIIIVLVVLRGTVLDWIIIPPGYTGIKVNRLVNRGITREDVVTGFVFFNPIQSVVITYPTFVQRVIWTHDMKEGNPVNEELTFPPRQNSCRPDMILNLGAIRTKDGTVRRSIQEQDGGAVTAAGERECWRSGKRNRSVSADIGTLA